MKEMGSKTGEFAPEPRDQYVWQKNNGETALDRLIGYVKLHSVGRHPPCAFMVHENGNPYSSRQIAVGLGWTHGHTQNTITAGKRAGLLRQLGRRGAIGLSGQVPGASEERRNNGDEADKAKSPVQVISFFLNHGLLAHIKGLSHELQKEAFLYAKAFDTWAAGVQARKAAEGRQIVHEAQYNVFPLFGYKPPPAKPKKAAPKLSFEEELAQVIAPPVPVAFRAPGAVAEITCTGDDSSPVQVTVSLLTSETTREELTKGPPSASAEAEGVQPVCIPGLVETPDALDSISKREIRTGQTGPHVSFENKADERADTEAIERVSFFDLNGGGKLSSQSGPHAPPQNKAVKRTTEATIVRDSAESEKTQCQTKKRKHA
jgi:hypothetical protein